MPDTENSPKYTFGAKVNGVKPSDTPGLLYKMF